MISRHLIAVAVLASAPLPAAVAHAQLGRDKVAFPQDYAKGVLFPAQWDPKLGIHVT